MELFCPDFWQAKHSKLSRGDKNPCSSNGIFLSRFLATLVEHTGDVKNPVHQMEPFVQIFGNPNVAYWGCKNSLYIKWKFLSRFLATLI